MGIVRKEDVHSSFDDYIKEVVDYDSTITSLNAKANKDNAELTGIATLNGHKISTQERVNINVIPSNNWTIYKEDNYIINNILYLNVEVGLTDETIIPTEGQFSPFTLPEGAYNKKVATTVSYAPYRKTSTMFASGNTCSLWFDGRLYLYNAINNTYRLKICGVCVLEDE